MAYSGVVKHNNAISFAFVMTKNDRSKTRLLPLIEIHKKKTKIN